MPKTKIVMSADQYAALSQAQASIGHALECLEDGRITGKFVDDIALAAEGFAKLDVEIKQPTG